MRVRGRTSFILGESDTGRHREGTEFGEANGEFFRIRQGPVGGRAGVGKTGLGKNRPRLKDS